MSEGQRSDPSQLHCDCKEGAGGGLSLQGAASFERRCQPRGSVTSLPLAQGSLISQRLFWKGEEAGYLDQPALCSLSHQRLAARSSRRRKGRPLILPQQEQEDRGLHHMEEQPECSTHTCARSQTRISPLGPRLACSDLQQ